MSVECSLSRFSEINIYESSNSLYLTGSSPREITFSLLKFNRNVSSPKNLSDIIFTFPDNYPKSDIIGTLNGIEAAENSPAKVSLLLSAQGLVGFIKFLDCFYITVVTKKKFVGVIANNMVYSIKATKTVPIRPRDEYANELSFRSLWHHVNKRLSQTPTEVAESKYMGLFQFMDITKSFFFSYTYDLTHSVQDNTVIYNSSTPSSPRALKTQVD